MKEGEEEGGGSERKRGKEGGLGLGLGSESWQKTKIIQEFTQDGGHYYLHYGMY